MQTPLDKIKDRTTKDLVIKHLTEDALRRDNDERLVSKFWNDELIAMGKNPDFITGMELLKLHAEGRLTSADIITRARRIVQNENEHLRGTKWNLRHGAGKDVQEHINN